MYIGKIVGNIVATKKEESLTGQKLMVVDLIKSKEKESGTTIVAVDLVGAGRGEHVLISYGSSARASLKNVKAPVDAAIVGIIDSYDSI